MSVTQVYFDVSLKYFRFSYNLIICSVEFFSWKFQKQIKNIVPCTFMNLYGRLGVKTVVKRTVWPRILFILNEVAAPGSIVLRVKIRQ